MDVQDISNICWGGHDNIAVFYVNVLIIRIKN